MATIYVIKGPNDGDAYTLEEEAIVIGRGDDCGVTLKDEKTSRAHLQISFDSATGKHIAEDLRSTNGTWCNGKTMNAPTQLVDGDVLELGGTSLEYSSRTFSSNEAAIGYLRHAEIKVRLAPT